MEISNIVYKNITGVSASKEAINFKCSKSFLCHEIWLEDVNLDRQEDENVKASCESVKSTNQGNVSPLF
jgi:polygalacturonase